MLATQPNITQTEYCDINSLTPAELNTVLACPVDGQSPPGSDNGRDLDKEKRGKSQAQRRAHQQLGA